MYQREFHENLETPEQVRAKMAERLLELKEKREQERQDLVARCYEKRFRDTTDELRKEDAKFYLKQCALEREEQMIEKRRAMEEKIMEESLYAELWKQDMRIKEAKEK